MFKALLSACVLLTCSSTAGFCQSIFEPAAVLQAPPVQYAGSAWGDYDNDGDLDLALSGRAVVDAISGPELTIFRNDGGQGFRKVAHRVRGVEFARLEWGDYDGDGDLDLLMSSYLLGELRVCTNLGRDVFRPVNYPAFPTSGGYDGHWVDLNRDGQVEIVCRERQQVYQYKYTPGVGFTRQPINGLPTGLEEIETAWGDYDKDGDVDLFLHGNDYGTTPFSRDRVYQNDGQGNFSPTGITTRPAYNPSTWADVDADGDLDLAFVSFNGSGPGGSLLFYLNNGNGTFAEKEIPMGSLGRPAPVFADYDNDGDQDMVLNAPTTKFYTNQGNFQYVHDASINAYYETFFPAFGDYDNDGDLDAMLTRDDYSGQTGGTLLRNTRVENGKPRNQAPATPLNPQAVLTATLLTLTWNPATDTESRQPTLAYALYIRRDTAYQVGPHANPATGYRHKTDGFQCYRGTTARFNVENWPEGHYSWAVQAVDGALGGSPFSVRGEFTIYRNNPADAPGALAVAAIVPASVRLTWQDRAANEAGYVVERAVHTPVSFRQAAVLAANATGYTDAGLQPNTTYYYRVKMNRSSGAPGYSAIVQTQTLPVIANAPSVLAAQPLSQTQVKLQWQDNSDGETGFQIERAKDVAAPFVAVATAGAGSTTYTDEGLAAGAKYLYRVRAVNQAGASGYSNVASTVTLVQSFSATHLNQKLNREFMGGVSVVDFDNDGHQDLFVAGGYLGGNVLYRNTGKGTFVPGDTALSNALGLASFSSCVWGDYDNDGYADLFIANGQGPDRLYHNRGKNATPAGHFERVTFGDMVNEYNQSQSANWVDYDHDGDLDLFAFTSGGVLLYRNNGNDTKGQTMFTQVTTAEVLPLRGGSSSGSWADYDNDGDEDLCVGEEEGRHLYVNQGNGTFGKGGPLFTASEFYEKLSHNGSWGDYDNDGDLDLALPPGPAQHGYEYYPLILLENSGKGSFSKVAGQSLVTDATSGVGSSWVDYDNDGWLDLSLMSGANSTRLFAHNGDSPATFSRVFDQPVVGPGAGTSTGVWADFNNDGSLDFFTGTHVLLNGGNANGWLKVRLQGSASNALGVGARVFVKAGGRWMQRHLTTQHGYRVQNGFELVFGLGNAPVADSIRVEWPSGTRQYLTQVTRNQLLLIKEADAAQKPLYGPVNLLAKVTAPTRVSLTWQDKAADETGFLLERSPGSDSSNFQPLATLPANATAYFDNAVAAGKAYFYRLKATRETAGSPWSHVARADVSQFTRVLTGRITKDYFEQFESATWGDYDNDGWQDLFVANRYRSYLYRNRGEGPGNEVSFDKVTTHPILQDDAPFGTGSWVDTDNDGDLDLYVATGPNTGAIEERLHDRLYRNDGNGAFTRITQGSLVNDGKSSHQGAWGDYDNDGRVDVFVSNGYGSQLHHNEGNNSFALAAKQPFTGYGSQFASWCDYDNDGDL
ncbi:MAG: VCBS repeat-containing protein, partial [Cytophagales bacterium]|nr:VCBS repeat-containing protein [Cytophagales bacterium]